MNRIKFISKIFFEITCDACKKVYHSPLPRDHDEGDVIELDDEAIERRYWKAQHFCAECTFIVIKRTEKKVATLHKHGKKGYSGNTKWTSQWNKVR